MCLSLHTANDKSPVMTRSFTSMLMCLQILAARTSGNAKLLNELEKVADLDSHADGLRLLLQCYLQTGRLPDAGNIAGKLFTVHSDSAAITSYTDALIASGQFHEALQVYEQYAERG